MADKRNRASTGRGSHGGGWQLRQRGEVWWVRWSQDGQRVERSTGERDRAAAQAAAQQIFEAWQRGVKALKRGEASPVRQHEELVPWVAAWLDSLQGQLRPQTIQVREVRAMAWLKTWTTVEELTEPALRDFYRERLKAARSQTVRAEQSQMRRFLAWLVECGAIAQAPQIVPVPKNSGTPAAKEKRATRTKAPPLSQEEVLAVLSALPEYSTQDHFPVRARFVVQYWTALRPTAIQRLKVPANYVRGQSFIRLAAEDDKEGLERNVALTREAREALDSVCPDVGLIFGDRMVTPYLRRAALSVLPESKAAIFCGQHFRSASITHWLQRGAALTSVQAQAGHAKVSTTALYVRATEREAHEMVAAFDLGQLAGTVARRAR